MPIIIVGNKSDIAKPGIRQVESRQVQADWIDSGEAMLYMETSAMNFKNIEEVFESIAEQANDYQQHMLENRETINDL